MSSAGRTTESSNFDYSLAERAAPVWMKYTLRAAGIYNLLWGTIVVLFPAVMFDWLDIEQPRYPELWQCIGMMVGVFGVGYWIAGSNPRRHWPMVLVGFLGKVFGPIGFLNAALTGKLPWSFGLINITNDLIWWIPFALILYDALKFHYDPAPGKAMSLDQALSSFTSHRGRTLAELSASGPVLVLFVRHAGCVFCREALTDLARDRATLEREGITLAVVHMSPPLEATQFFANYQLEDVHRFSDPNCQLYRAFGLERGKISQLLGPRIWWRGFLAWRQGYGFSTVQGDGFQLGGAFMLKNGEILASQRARNAAERLNFAQLACATSECRVPAVS